VAELTIFFNFQFFIVFTFQIILYYFTCLCVQEYTEWLLFVVQTVLRASSMYYSIVFPHPGSVHVVERYMTSDTVSNNDLLAHCAWSENQSSLISWQHVQQPFEGREHFSQPSIEVLQEQKNLTDEYLLCWRTKTKSVSESFTATRRLIIQLIIAN